MAKKRKFIDWDSIEPLYRAGGLTLSKICEQYELDHVNSQVWKKTVTHAAILKKAKDKKWTRNLANKVKERIKEKLITNSVTNCNLTEDEIVDQVSEAGTNVIVRHRKEIKDLIDQEDALLEELKIGTMTKRVKGTDADGNVTETEVEVKLLLKDRAKIFKNIVECRAKRIALERQAYNLEDDGRVGDAFSKEANSFLKKVINTNKDKIWEK